MNNYLCIGRGPGLLVVTCAVGGLLLPGTAGALDLKPSPGLAEPGRVPVRSVAAPFLASGGGFAEGVRAQLQSAHDLEPRPAATALSSEAVFLLAQVWPAAALLAEKPALQTRPEPKLEPKLEPKPEPKPEPKREAKAAPEPEAQTVAKPPPGPAIKPSPADKSAAPAAGPARTPPPLTLMPRLQQLQALLGVPAVLEIEPPEVLRARAVQRGVMSLESALALGVAESVDARIAGVQQEGQQATGRAAWRQLGPKLDYRIAEGEGEYTAVTGPTPRLRRGDQSLTLRQPLFDWTSYHEALRQASNTEAASLVRQNAESLAALESANIYLATLQSRLIISYTVEYEALLRKLLQFMNDRAAAGGASPADLERVRARVENIRAANSENRAGLVTNLTQFVRLIGRLPERIEIPRVLTGPLPGNEQRAIDTALERNFELRAARSFAEAAGYERTAARGRLIPRLDLEIARSENRNPSGSAGLQVDERALVILSWNLFNSGVDVAQSQAVAARRSEFLLRVENSERRLRQQLESSYSVLDSIRARFEAVREEVAANRKVVEAFNEQLFATNRQLLDVLDAYQRFYQSKVDLTNLLVTEAQVQVQVAHLVADLYRAGGDAAARR